MANFCRKLACSKMWILEPQYLKITGESYATNKYKGEILEHSGNIWKKQALKILLSVIGI